MSVTILFLALIASIVGWFLAHQRLTAKPWLEVGGSAMSGTPSHPPPSWRR